ncbi:hypothetical protein D9611_014870 [Ephemerocybe angulata]|uniref:PABS domain-containing protein n=1 Tax=Ephemerocybe angulata TaxID=980116 RepID=A0A8H5B6S4_9AGAR|nr:hypothetical protein D9611_014870 [Tulosesus angulatus]
MPTIQAVVRVSKQFLPHMSNLLNDPRVTVYIGDGFKFLADNESTYDCIITDSSDPVGPAASLFQKPYFQLLHDALTPGGHISTQGESLWLHLPLIKELRDMTSKIFSVSEYAYTTIPTYPSGPLAAALAATSALRPSVMSRTPGTARLSTPLLSTFPSLPVSCSTRTRTSRPSSVAAFSLENKPAKKILLLGSGFVARPCAEYIVRGLRTSLPSLVVLSLALKPSPSTTGISLDVNNEEALDKAVIKSAIKGKTHVVTTSYVNPAMRELDQAAKDAGIVVFNEIGLDPGIDHLYAVKTIDEVHAKGGKIKKFLSYCGGLPPPILLVVPRRSLALLNNASFYESGEAISVGGKELMAHANPYYITPAFAFVAYPNRDSKPFREFYGIEEAETVIRGTLRYQGFPEFIKTLVDMGFLNADEKEWLKEGASPLTWKELTQKAVGAESSNESVLIAKIKELATFPNESEAARITQGLRWIGLFSSEKLETLMKYEDGERDLVMLQHKFFVEWADGSEQVLTSTMEAYGSPKAHSAMALTVGLPCGIATQLVLDGVLNKAGVQAPYTKDVCDPIREILEANGVSLVERAL